MKKRAILFILIAAPVCLLCPAIIAAVHSNRQTRRQAATKPATLRERLQQQLKDWHAAGKFPGATVGVALPDGTSFGLAVGYSDTTTKRSMSPDDLLLQGSVGKTYVAAVALQLVHEGKINLDDKIEKWFARENGSSIYRTRATSPCEC